MLESAEKEKLETGWTPSPPGRPRLFDREDEHLEHVRNLTRQRVRRYRDKMKQSTNQCIIRINQVRSNDDEHVAVL